MFPGGNGPENGFWERGGDSMNIRCFDALQVAWVDKPARLDDTGGVPKGRPGEFSRRPISGECKLPLPAPRGSVGFPDQVRLRRFFPGLNRMVLPGGIRTSIPVRGFRPIPFFRGLTWKTPKPRNSIRSPFFIERFIASRTASTATTAFTRLMSAARATLLIMSDLIIPRPPILIHLGFNWLYYDK